MPSLSLPAQLARTRRFRLGAPDRFTISADGGTVLFLRSRAGDDPVTCLWALDVGDGRERLLADPEGLTGGATEGLPEEERTRRERAREEGSGIVSYAADEAAGVAVFALSGELWAVQTASGLSRRLPTAGAVVDPRPDPTGQRIAYVCGGALRVAEVDGAADRAIAEPSGPDIGFGLAEHVASESMGRHRGYWWAPDGTRLLVARVDTAAVERWYIADPAEPARPPRAVRYPVAGTANAEVTLWIIGLDGERTQVRWDVKAFEYVPAAGWDDYGPFAAVQSRDQRTVRVLGIDPADGTTRVLAEQRDECWVQLVGGLPARAGDGSLIGHADLGGTRHLTVGGETVTPPGLQLREVLGADRDEVLFTACTDPAQADLWSYRSSDGARRLTAEPGVHSGVRRGGTLVHTAWSPDRPGSRVTVERPGQPDVPIESLAQRPVLDVHATPLVLGLRELRAELFWPSWHRPGGGKLPVLLDPYGGPAGQKVAAMQGWLEMTSQWLAEQGFAVLVADGRGTPGRGPVWEREVYGDVLGPALEDQVAALTEAARSHPELDLGRVGIRGWSFGGSLAALAVLRRPDVFHAAVAGAAPTDLRLYDTHWRERFYGHPDRYPERYEANSLLREAPNLARPLLLIHGLADDNVFPANMLRLSSALLAAGRPHEVLPLTGATHRVSNETAAENLLWHEIGFFRRHLGQGLSRAAP
ncbi:MAG TPA: prolyl oligopeptidase family serine peptidase [Streptosporangiaceae bacterium]